MRSLFFVALLWGEGKGILDTLHGQKNHFAAMINLPRHLDFISPTCKAQDTFICQGGSGWHAVWGTEVKINVGVAWVGNGRHFNLRIAYDFKKARPFAIGFIIAFGAVILDFRLVVAFA